MAETEVFFDAAESLDAAAEDLGTVDEGLTVEDSEVMDSINESTEDLAEVSDKELANLDDPDTNFKEFTEKPEFESAEDNVNMDEQEQSDTGTSSEEADSLKTKFKAKIKSLLPKLGGWLETNAGKIIMEGIGSYFKYKFIVDETNVVAKDIDAIVKDGEGKGGSSGKETPEQKKTETKLDSFLKVVSAMMKIGSGLGQTLKNASGFSTSGDMNTPGTGANLAMQMKALDLANIASQTTKALQATSSMLTNIQGALKELGYSKGEPISSIVKSVIANPTLLNNAMGAVDIKKVESFKTEVSRFVQTTQSVIQGPTYAGNREEQNKMELFFRINPGWKKNEAALEDAISATGKSAANILY